MTALFRLYSRPDCHLCQQMLEDLKSFDQQHRFTVQIFNIDTDPELQHRFTARIPVLAADNGDEIICEQVLDRQAVTDYLLTRSG